MHQRRAKFGEPIEDASPLSVESACLNQSRMQCRSQGRVSLQRQALIQKDRQHQMEAGALDMVCRELQAAGVEFPLRRSQPNTSSLDGPGDHVGAGFFRADRGKGST